MNEAAAERQLFKTRRPLPCRVRQPFPCVARKDLPYLPAAAAAADRMPAAAAAARRPQARSNVSVRSRPNAAANGRSASVAKAAYQTVRVTSALAVLRDAVKGRRRDEQPNGQHEHEHEHERQSAHLPTHGCRSSNRS
jgi:hypothetical protein